MHWVMWQVIETAISISQIAKCGEKRRRWIYTYQREKQQQQRRQRGIYFCWYLIYNNDCDIKLTKITHKWTVDGRSKSGKKTVQNNTQSMQLMSFSTTSPLNWLNRAAFSSLTHSVARIVFCLKYLLDCWWLAGWCRCFCFCCCCWFILHLNLCRSTWDRKKEHTQQQQQQDKTKWKSFNNENVMFKWHDSKL